MRREIASGLMLGCILGTTGLFRILLWPWRTRLWRALRTDRRDGGVQPDRSLWDARGLDAVRAPARGLRPASARPFVATLVDGMGIGSLSVATCDPSPGTLL
jgi:hypothetical protein